MLVDEDEIDAHPMKGLGVPSAPAKPVPVLSDTELAALIKACAGKDCFARRDEAVVRLLLDCGMRVAELCVLTVEGTNLDAEVVLVTGKGSKVRPVYFGAPTARALDRYLRGRSQHRWAHVDALFLGQRGPLTPDGVRELLRVRGETAGITDLHPHRFRHTWAHHWVESTVVVDEGVTT